MMTVQRQKSWSYRSGQNQVCAVTLLPSGLWIGTMGPNRIMDPHGNHQRQETFADVESALDFVGYPWDIVGIPEELR